MKKEYDFSRIKMGPDVSMPPGKTRITIRLDVELIEWFKGQIHAAGSGNYQTLINSALREYVNRTRGPLEVQEQATEQSTSPVVRTAFECREAIFGAGLVACGDAEADLSTAYKSRLHEGFDRKHGEV